MTALKCGHSEHSKRYSEKYDAAYCEKCNAWIDKSCGCAYCHARPEKPIMPKSLKPKMEIEDIPVPKYPIIQPHVCFKEGVWNNFLRSFMID